MLSVDERKVPVSTWVLPTRVPTETWEQPGLQGPMACGAPAGDGDAARGASRPCGLRVSEEKPLCADRPEGRRPRSGEELAAPLGGGASSREVSPALQPGSGAPRAGPDPLPLGSGLRSSSPDAPAPPREPAARDPDPGRSIHPAQGAAGLLPNLPGGRGVLGPARRPHLQDGVDEQPASGSSCASAPGSAAQRGPQASRLGR